MTSTPTTAQIVALAVDAAAPHVLAGFWARALRWDMASAAEDAIDLVPTDATSFRLQFQPQTTHKAGQNRIHFDLTTTSIDDQRDTVAELLAIGATHVDIGQGLNEPHVVLADPEGNEFCVIEPSNRFLSGCPRLGALNCDGTSALGHFYSDVLGWPLVWDQDEETAIQSPLGTGPKITWSGPPLMPRPRRERFHFHLAPKTPASARAALDHILASGAAHLEIADGCPGAIALADVDGNRFCLVDQ